jgi:hypothetical protein
VEIFEAYLGGKAVQDCVRRWMMVPGIECTFLGVPGVVAEIKSPCGGRGFGGIGLEHTDLH